MKRRNSKKIIILLLVTVIIVVVVGIIIWNNLDKEPDGYDIYSEKLVKDYSADIIVYGEEPGFRESVVYRHVDEITEETLYSDDSHGYQVVLLFDYKGTMEITDEELMLIKKYAEEKGYDMMYIGKKYLDTFKELGFTKGCDEDEYGLEYLGSRYKGMEAPESRTGNMYARHGIWTDEDEEWLEYNADLLQESIISTMHLNASQMSIDDN